MTLQRNSGAAVLRATAAALVLRCTVGLVAVVALLAASHVIIEHAFGGRAADARTLELVAEQRVLVQRVASSARALVAEADPDARAILVDAVAQLDDGHQQLHHGRDGLVTRVPTPEMRRLAQGRSGLDEATHDFLEHARVVAMTSADAARRDHALARVTTAADGALDAPLAATLELERQRIEVAQRQDRALVRLLGVIGVLAVVALVAGVLLRPLARELRAAADTVEETQLAERRRQGWQAEFAAIANHELRSPVTVLVGLARTLHQHEHDLSPELRREIIQRLDAQGQVMTELLDELSTVAGLSSSTPDLDRVSIPDLLSEVRGGRDDVTALPCDITVVADAGRLRLVLRELVENGLRHGAAPVVVAAEARGDTLVLGVRDHGDGIPEEDARRLLEAFTIGPSSLHHGRSDGRGLGLSMVNAVVEEGGGSLRYRREATGGTWIVLLPDLVVGGPFPGVRVDEPQHRVTPPSTTSPALSR